MQIANEIRPKQHGIGLLQMLQYTTAQISLLLPTFTTHNMLVFVDMLHSFELGFALHLCKKKNEHIRIRMCIEHQTVANEGSHNL